MASIAVLLAHSGSNSVAPDASLRGKFGSRVSLRDETGHRSTSITRSGPCLSELRIDPQDWPKVRPQTIKLSSRK